jgi:hypothetical protein
MYQKISLDQKPEKVSNYWTRSLYRVMGCLDGNKGHGMGIDPGVNFGCTFIKQDVVAVYYGQLRQVFKPGEYGVIAINLLQSLPEFRKMKGACIIEGAAFHKTFGQVGLAEVREGFYIGAKMADGLTNISHVEIIPPATIRKIVFNNGKEQAGDHYPTLNHNGADSISIAQYALTSRQT